MLRGRPKKSKSKKRTKGDSPVVFLPQETSRALWAEITPQKAHSQNLRPKSHQMARTETGLAPFDIGNRLGSPKTPGALVQGVMFKYPFPLEGGLQPKPMPHKSLAV